MDARVVALLILAALALIALLASARTAKKFEGLSSSSSKLTLPMWKKWLKDNWAAPTDAQQRAALDLASDMNIIRKLVVTTTVGNPVKDGDNHKFSFNSKVFGEDSTRRAVYTVTFTGPKSQANFNVIHDMAYKLSLEHTSGAWQALKKLMAPIISTFGLGLFKRLTKQIPGKLTKPQQDYYDLLMMHFAHEAARNFIQGTKPKPTTVDSPCAALKYLKSNHKGWDAAKFYINDKMVSISSKYYPNKQDAENLIQSLKTTLGANAKFLKIGWTSPFRSSQYAVDIQSSDKTKPFFGDGPSYTFLAGDCTEGMKRVPDLDSPKDPATMTCDQATKAIAAAKNSITALEAERKVIIDKINKAIASAQTTTTTPEDTAAKDELKRRRLLETNAKDKEYALVSVNSKGYGWVVLVNLEDSAAVNKIKTAIAGHRGQAIDKKDFTSIQENIAFSQIGLFGIQLNIMMMTRQMTKTNVKSPLTPVETQKLEYPENTWDRWDMNAAGMPEDLMSIGEEASFNRLIPAGGGRSGYDILSYARGSTFLIMHTTTSEQALRDKKIFAIKTGAYPDTRAAIAAIKKLRTDLKTANSKKQVWDTILVMFPYVCNYNDDPALETKLVKDQLKDGGYDFSGVGSGCSMM